MKRELDLFAILPEDKIPEKGRFLFPSLFFPILLTGAYFTLLIIIPKDQWVLY